MMRRRRKNVGALITNRCMNEEFAPYRVEISHLLGMPLRTSLVAVVEPVNCGFAARAADFRVIGYGDDAAQAVEVLRQGIESMYESEEFLDFRYAIQSMLS